MSATSRSKVFSSTAVSVTGFHVFNVAHSKIPSLLPSPETEESFMRKGSHKRLYVNVEEGSARSEHRFELMSERRMGLLALTSFLRV
jgi:hypothetical protein